MKHRKNRAIEPSFYLKYNDLHQFKKKAILSILFFWCLFIFLPLYSSTNPLKAEAFLQTFCLKEGAIYTLLGDKPITDMLIFIGSPEDISLEGLSNKTLQKIEYVEDTTLEDWKAWKKFSKNLFFPNFRFIERPCLNDPSYINYMLININALRKALEKHFALFTSKLKTDFNIDQAIDELNNPQSLFWNNVLKDHYLSGLLYGYGEENCNHFMQICLGKSTSCFYEEPVSCIDTLNILLPRFSISSEDRSIEKYSQHREKIQQFYKGKAFFQTTLQILQSQGSGV